MDLVAGRVWADERRPIRHIDLVLLLLTGLLVVGGLFLLYSATNQTLRQDGLDPFSRVTKQAVTAVIGLVLVLVIATFDYRFFKVYAGFLYAGVVLSLVLVRIPGIGATDATGTAQRWFGLAGFQVTPSEFVKLALIIVVAALLSELKTSEPTLRDVVRVIALAVLPLGLVLLQPDIGTSIVIVVIAMGMLVVSGARWKHLIALSLVGLALLFVLFQTHVIQEYQLDRIRAFLDREGVSADARYNLDQSLIAVGSGGLLGRGYLSGTQTNLDYVPEQHTDFIFTVAGEEFGFVGASTVLLLYALLMWRAIRIASLSKDPFGTFVAAGIASMFAIQMFVNVGMVIGIMPITGIPLPFLSFGGSSMLASMIAIGMLESIHMRRFT